MRSAEVLDAVRARFGPSVTALRLSLAGPAPAAEPPAPPRASSETAPAGLDAGEAGYDRGSLWHALTGEGAPYQTGEDDLVPLADPHQGQLVLAPGALVPVERVVDDVALRAGEPLEEGLLGVLEDLVPLLRPVEALRAAARALRTPGPACEYL